MAKRTKAARPSNAPVDVATAPAKRRTRVAKRRRAERRAERREEVPMTSFDGTSRVEVDHAVPDAHLDEGGEVRTKEDV